VLGAVGSLIARKSVDHLLKAVAPIVAENALPLHLLIVGEGPQHGALKKLANDIGLAEHITFAGFQNQALPWIAAMDVFVLASAKEGLPRVILEAMLLGKPVVASNVIGSRELVSDGETGLLYDYGNIEALTARLKELLADENKRAAMGAAGRKRVLAEYSIEHYVEEVQNVLTEASA
jgi:glycosyltransferase involved in cell wall biosynthesis